MQALPAFGQALSRLINPPKESPAPAAAPAPAQPDGELLDLVNKRYRHSQSHKLPMLKVWSTCLAFYVGDQWRRWDQRAKRLVVRTRIPEWRVLPVYNQIPGIIDTAASSLGGTQQLPQARPDNEGDDRSKEEARQSTHALQGWAYRLDFDLARHETDVNRILFGQGFIHLYWDPSQLAKVPVPDQYGGGIRAQHAPVGELCPEILTVFDVFPDPQEKWSDCQYVIIARRKPMQWYKETFPDKGSQVQPDKGEADSAYTSLLPGADGAFGMGETTGGPEQDQLATLKIYYEKPSRTYPKGRTVYVAGQTVLFRLDRLPLPFDGCKDPFPVHKIGYRYVPKRLWDKGLIEECLSPQEELNRGLGNLAELFRLYRGPKWFAPKGSIKNDAITGAPDEVVVYTGDKRPEAVPPPPLPAWVSEYPQQQIEQMRGVAGQHEVSEGMVPPGVQAASAIALLQQAESKRTDTPARLGKYGYQNLLKHVLVVLAQYYREPRMLTVPQRGGKQSTAILQPGQLTPLDVEITLVTGIEDNDAVRTQQVNDWMGVGLFQMPLPLQLAILRDVGQTWLADAIEEAQPAIQMEQQAQAAQQQAMVAQQAAAQGGPSGPDPQAQMALQEQQQGAQAQQQQVQSAQQATQQTAQAWQQALLQHQKQGHEARQAQAQRDHELRMARINSQARAQRPQARN